MNADQLRLECFALDEGAASPRIRDGVVLTNAAQRILEALERHGQFESIFKLAVEAECSYVWGYEVVHQLERLGMVALDRIGPCPKPIAVRRVK